MKHSYVLAGIRLTPLTRLIRRNGVSASPRHLFRLLFLLQNAVWSSLLSRMEKKRFDKQLQAFPDPRDPIFIVGHWRTGSTFFHQLLNLDNRFTAPSVFQVSVPDNFLVSRRYYEPIMSRMLDPVRPMDQVKLGFDEPQEDEYAIIKMGIHSPLERLVFPQSPGYFLSGGISFLPEKEELDRWKDLFLLFCRKLALQTGKRLVFKNPFHSMRVDLLKEMFPEAHFIHIYRDPFVVIPSTIRMWSIVGRQNCLRKYPPGPALREVTEVYKRVMKTLRTSLNNLPPDRYSEIRFEELEKNPLQTVKMLYERIGLSLQEENIRKIRDFLVELGDYQKNRYLLTGEERQYIATELKDDLSLYGYPA